MKVAIIFLAIIAVALAANTKMYTSKFDDVDVDGIIGSDRLLRGYVKCLLDKGPCTNEGNTLKDILPDALRTSCESCTEKQKTKSEKVIRHLVNNKKELWDELAVKYDPNNEYRKKYEDQAKAKGINV
ncbi:allergen Tha p 1-like [Microplitis mediator]|uniref:allergen Tha p 1-like n=1 Tax=Microplitis mediator TaxID=375433 RepID=UPI0025551220|nr:allergen Tha p 1-like [Microplitis mediator]